MFGVRDVAWAVGLGMLMILLVQCRAEWSAKSALERDAERGFLVAYDGSRFITGELVTPGQGGYIDSTKPTIEARRFEIIGVRQSLTGSSIEVVARHVIKLLNGAPGGEDASQEVHAKLERKGKAWVYTLFETRDGQLVEPPGEGNPWARSLQARASVATEQPGTGQAIGTPGATEGD